MGLLVEESTLKNQVEAVERRAKSRCSEYNALDIYWSKVDLLLAYQDKLLAKIRASNEEMMSSKAAPKELISVALKSPAKK